MSDPTSHHYIPQCYLKGFTIPDPKTNKMIWAYDKQNRYAQPHSKPQSIKSCACEDNYYATENEDGSVCHKMETGPLHTLDTDFNTLLEKVSSATGVYMGLGDEDKAKLAFCIALLFSRVPSFRTPAQERHTKAVKLFTLAHKHLLPPKPVGYENDPRLDPENLIVQIKPWKTLEDMVEMTKELSVCLLSRPWLFIRASGSDYFLTCDNPVTFNNGSPFHPLSDISVPLTRDLCLIISNRNPDPDQTIVKSTKLYTDEQNLSVICSAKRYIFSHLKAPEIAKAIAQIEKCPSSNSNFESLKKRF